MITVNSLEEAKAFFKDNQDDPCFCKSGDFVKECKSLKEAQAFFKNPGKDGTEAQPQAAEKKAREVRSLQERFEDLKHDADRIIRLLQEERAEKEEYQEATRLKAKRADVSAYLADLGADLWPEKKEGATNGK